MKVSFFFLNIIILFKSCEMIELTANISQFMNVKDYGENHLLNRLIQRQKPSGKPNNSNAECFKSVVELLGVNFNLASLKFLDAWGKIPSGILYGHLVDLGNFDECLSARKPILQKELRGKYFLMQVTLLTNRPLNPKTLRHATSSRMASVFSMNLNGQLSLNFGTCFPHVCSVEDVRNIFQTSVQTLGELSALLSGGINEENNTAFKAPVYFNVLSSSIDNGGDESYDVPTILAISIFSTFGILMLLSSFYDYFMTLMDAPPNQLLISFSILTNGRKLFHINTNTSNNNSIDCLNGIRVISMMWVIFGHTHLLTSFFPLTNTIDIVDWIKVPYSMLLQAATVSVDSFLLMSGALLAFVTLPKIEKAKGSLNIPLMYFHRYIRLTPVLAAAILFAVGIVPLIVQGPFAPFFSSYIGDNCHKNWWATLLYVNNYVERYNLCLTHTWYLSVDTQLFLISPIILLGLWKWKSKFLWVLLILAALSYGCCISTMITNKYNGILLNSLVNPQQFVHVYYPTHIRMSPWLIGMGFGYWLHCNRNNKPILSVLQLLLGWAIAVALWMAVLFGPYHFAKNSSEPTVLEAALYEAFGRSAWSLGLTWIIFVCHTGNSRTVNAFLSYSGWQPIVRLTYTMYISAVIVQAVNAANIKTDKYFSNYSVIQTYWSELGIILSFSIIIVLALESPIIAMEKYFFTPKKPKVETTIAIEEDGSER